MRLTNVICPMVVVMGLLAVDATQGQGLRTVGGEQTLFAKTPGRQSAPSAVLWEQGGLVVWENSGESGKKHVYIQSVDSSRASRGTATRVSQGVPGINDVNPVIRIVNEQAAVVVWVSGERGAQDVYLQIVARDGRSVGAIQRVNQTASRNQMYPDVAVSPNGRIMVVWESEGQDGDGTGVYGRMFGASGEGESGEVLISQTTAGNQNRPKAVNLGGERFMVSWITGIINGRNAEGGLKLRNQMMGRFFKGIIAERNEFRISGADSLVSGQDICLSSNGGVFLAWMQRTEINGEESYDIWGVVLDSQTGVSIGEPTQINEFESGRQLNPKVGSYGGVNFCVWESMEQDSAGSGIFGKEYPGGREVMVNSQRNHDQYDPAIVIDPKGRLLVLWANTIRSDSSVISLQEYEAGEGAGAEVVSGDSPNGSTTEVTPVTIPSAAPAVVSSAVGGEIPGIGDVAPAASPGGGNQMPQLPPPTRVPVVVGVQSNPVNIVNPPGEVQRVNSVQYPRSNTTTAGVSAPSLSQAQMAASSALRQLPRSNRSALFTRPAGSTGYRPGALRNTTGITGATENMSPSRIAMLRAAQSSMTPGSRSESASGSLAQMRARSRIQQGASIGSSSVGQTRSVAQPRNSSGIQSQRFTPAGRVGAEGQPSESRTAKSRFELMREQAARAAESQALKQVPAGLQVSDSGIMVTWTGRAGARYQVQGSGNRVDWKDFGAIQNGRSGQNASPVDRSFRFYRVIEKN